MTEPIHPIAPTAGNSELDTSSRPAFARSSRFIQWTGGAVLVIAIGFLVWLMGAHIIDGAWGELLTALPLYLGVSAMGIVPGLLLYFMGRQARKFGPGTGVGLCAIAFGMPLFLLGIAAQNGGFSLVSIYGLFAGCLGVLSMIWGGLLLRVAGQKTRN